MTSRARETVVIGGALAQTAGLGGLTWVFLQYVLGFRQLGYDVLVLDRLEDDMCVDAHGRACSPEESTNLAYLLEVVRCFGLGDCFSLSLGGERTVGLERRQVIERAASCALFLNVSGYIEDESVRHAARPRLAYLDIDPGFGQMWHELGLADPFAGHDMFVTIGENVGSADCEIPTCGLEWITTPQPVVLHEWPASRSPSGRVTTVASWRGPNGPIEWGGKTYGLRVHEFRKFAELPRLADGDFEIALDIDEADAGDVELLREAGWVLRDPREVAADPWSYRTFVQRSSAELMVAKNIYVQSRSGWFSDRSICYLASGKPVIAQDTGFTRLYPTGEGLLSFSNLEEALTGIEQIASDYRRHVRAARALAEEHFESRSVLSCLVARLGESRHLDPYSER